MATVGAQKICCLDLGSRVRNPGKAILKTMPTFKVRKQPLPQKICVLYDKMNRSWLKACEV